MIISGASKRQRLRVLFVAPTFNQTAVNRYTKAFILNTTRGCDSLVFFRIHVSRRSVQGNKNLANPILLRLEYNGMYTNNTQAHASPQRARYVTYSATKQPTSRSLPPPSTLESRRSRPLLLLLPPPPPSALPSRCLRRRWWCDELRLLERLLRRATGERDRERRRGGELLLERRRRWSLSL